MFLLILHVTLFPRHIHAAKSIFFVENVQLKAFDWFNVHVFNPAECLSQLDQVTCTKKILRKKSSQNNFFGGTKTLKKERGSSFKMNATSSFRSPNIPKQAPVHHISVSICHKSVAELMQGCRLQETWHFIFPDKVMHEWFNGCPFDLMKNRESYLLSAVLLSVTLPRTSLLDLSPARPQAFCHFPSLPTECLPYKAVIAIFAPTSFSLALFLSLPPSEPPSLLLAPPETSACWNKGREKQRVRNVGGGGTGERKRVVEGKERVDRWWNGWTRRRLRPEVRSRHFIKGKQCHGDTFRLAGKDYLPFVNYKCTTVALLKMKNTFLRHMTVQMASSSISCQLLASIGSGWPNF